MTQKFIPNFTQYPNEILDEWMPHLSGNQTKIINVFVRQIYGFHKEYDKISIRQISQKTGITTAKVFSDVKNLIKIGCLKIIKHGNKSTPHTYEIINITDVLPERIHKRKSIGVTSEITGCYPRDNTGVTLEVTEVLPTGKQQNKEIYIKEKSERKEPENTGTQLTPNQLAQGFKSTRQIKETIYQYLQSKGIPISPGTDEQAIEKHKLTDPSELIFKIQRLEKLQYLKTHWREWENWIEKTQLPLFQKLELQAGSISWALSNYSTDVDAPYNLIESFIKRREEAERHKQAERERIEAERQEYYATLRDNPDEHQPPDTKTVYEKMADLKKQRAQESAVIEEEQKQTERLTSEEQIRLRDLILQGRMNLEEQLEYKSLIERNRR